FGGGPGQTDRDVHGGGVGLREEVDPELAEGEDAERDQEGHEHDREHGPADAELGQAHGLSAASTGAPSARSCPSRGTAILCLAKSPSTISTSSPLRSPSLTSASLSVRPSTRKTL